MGEAVDLIDLLGDSETVNGGLHLNNGVENPSTSTPSSANTAEDDLQNSSVNIHIVRSGIRLKGFARLDEAFLKPFFTRKFTDEVKIKIPSTNFRL
jgi:hypothetical protein